MKETRNKRQETKILDRDAAVLRQVAKPVPLGEIKSPKIKRVLEKMKEAMHAEDDSVAIAAPQIGESLRIFIVNTSALESIKKKGNSSARSKKTVDEVFINPEIIKLSKEKEKMEEGCLSIRWLYGEVKRSKKATIKAYNEDGKLFQKGASGLLAQIFQHETDHLDGILFTDSATNIRDLPPTDELIQL
jgi:peptide deformylase